jgi:hypothetical protein
MPMEIPVLIQPVPGKGFMATAGSPFGWTAHGSTATEALAKLQDEASRQLASGVQAATIAVPNGQSTAASAPPSTEWAKSKVINPPAPGTNPWLELAGTLDPADPLVQEWRKAVEEYRREVDSDPNR